MSARSVASSVAAGRKAHRTKAKMNAARKGTGVVVEHPLLAKLRANRVEIDEISAELEQLRAYREKLWREARKAGIPAVRCGEASGVVPQRIAQVLGPTDGQ